MINTYETATIVRKLYELYPNAENITEEQFKSMQTIAMNDATALTTDGTIALLLTELKECLDIIGMNVFDDPIEMMMNYTEPFEVKTIEDAEKILSQAVADGWYFPSWLTPKKFLAICEDYDSDIEEYE